MIILDNLTPSPSGEYLSSEDLNLYDSPQCQSLATQAKTGRFFKILSSSPVDCAVKIYLCEDGYTAWLPVDHLQHLQPTSQPYQPINVSRAEIEAKIPQIIAFTKAAMARPNYYVWGGTLAPNYDCSGLMQAAFAASGIWLPRDSYQQEAFTKKIAQEDLQAGDLVFFGKEKVDHVALYLGQGYYIHSSGKEEGRNGIAIDLLSAEGDPISQHYYGKRWSFGRVMGSIPFLQKYNSMGRWGDWGMGRLGETT